jgi:hypothetical protein
MKPRTLVLSIVTFVLATTIFTSFSQEPDYSQILSNIGFKLDSQFEKLILKREHSRKIIGIHKIETISQFIPDLPASKQPGYFVISIDLSILGDFRREGAWHGNLTFAKKISDPDWSRAISIKYPYDMTFQSLTLMNYSDLGAFIKKMQQAEQDAAANP